MAAVYPHMTTQPKAIATGRNAIDLAETDSSVELHKHAMTKTIKALRVTAPYLVTVPGWSKRQWVEFTVEGVGGNVHAIMSEHAQRIGATAWDVGQAVTEWVYETK